MGIKKNKSFTKGGEEKISPLDDHPGSPGTSSRGGRGSGLRGSPTRPGTAGSADGTNDDDSASYNSEGTADGVYREDLFRLFDGPKRHGFDGILDDKKKKDGFGIFYYENGDVYEGNWMGDLRHGKGKHYTLLGDCFDCIWKNDVIHDRRARIRYANGIDYVGQYVEGKKLGTCTYNYQDGHIEKGCWKKSGRYIEDVPGRFPPTLLRKLWSCWIDFFCPKRGMKSCFEDLMEWRTQWFIDEAIQVKEAEEKAVRLAAEEAERQRLNAEADAIRDAEREAERQLKEDGLDSVVSIPASLGGNSQAGVVTGAAVGGPVAAPDGGDGYGDDMSAVTGPA